jgi:hypothetical protein
MVISFLKKIHGDLVVMSMNIVKLSDIMIGVSIKIVLSKLILSKIKKMKFIEKITSNMLAWNS